MPKDLSNDLKVWLRSSLVTQWVKELVLSLLWYGFGSPAWELLHALGAAKKKKKFNSGIPKILKFALLRNMVGHVALPETQDVFAFIKMINTVFSCLTAW